MTNEISRFATAPGGEALPQRRTRMLSSGEHKNRKTRLRRYRNADPRLFLDKRMVELLELLDQIPYERDWLDPLEEG
jgi:hypothetical protein